MSKVEKLCINCHTNPVGSGTKMLCNDCYNNIELGRFTEIQKQDYHVNKKDLGKLPWHLLTEDMLEDIVKVLQFGREKYGENTWQNVGPDEYGNPPLVRYQDALKRHLAAFNCGEIIDEESKLPALAHVACNALFIAWLEKHPECNKAGPDVHKK